MSKDIRIKKGLDIKLVGEAIQTTNKLPIKGMFALNLKTFTESPQNLLSKKELK